MSIVADHPIEGGVRGTNDVEAEGGHLVAETVAKVNVPLLSTAPELLEVLQSFPGFLCDAGAGDVWIEKRRAAIAKVAGEAA